MDEDPVALEEALEFSALLGANAEMRKRAREDAYQKLVFGAIGEEVGVVELYVGDGHEMWQHKTLYCLREKQDEEKHKNRYWTPWRIEGEHEPAGRVALVARQRDWKPKESKYMLKCIEGPGTEDWRAFSVIDAVKTKQEMVDARRVQVKFQKREMSLQEAVEKIERWMEIRGLE